MTLADAERGFDRPVEQRDRSVEALQADRPERGPGVGVEVGGEFALVERRDQHQRLVERRAGGIDVVAHVERGGVQAGRRGGRRAVPTAGRVLARGADPGLETLLIAGEEGVGRELELQRRRVRRSGVVERLQGRFELAMRLAVAADELLDLRRRGDHPAAQLRVVRRQQAEDLVEIPQAVVVATAGRQGARPRCEQPEATTRVAVRHQPQGGLVPVRGRRRGARRRRLAGLGEHRDRRLVAGERRALDVRGARAGGGAPLGRAPRRRERGRRAASRREPPRRRPGARSGGGSETSSGPGPGARGRGRAARRGPGGRRRRRRRRPRAASSGSKPSPATAAPRSSSAAGSPSRASSPSIDALTPAGTSASASAPCLRGQPRPRCQPRASCSR